MDSLNDDKSTRIKTFKFKITDKFSCPLLYGIFGHKIEYSISPLIHNSIAKALKLDICYSRFDVDPVSFPVAFNGFKALKINGANITKPYKIDVIKYLDKLSADADLIGAVNTVKLQDHFYTGYNTDGDGFTNSIMFEFGTNLKDKNIILLGAGGASYAVLYSLIKEGARNVTIINRSLSNARDLFNKAASWVKTFNSKTFISYADFYSKDVNIDVFTNCNLIINTITPSNELHNNSQQISGAQTPDGSSAMLIQSLPLKHLNKNSFAIDISYYPALTPFMKFIEKNVLKCANGLSMLVFQAIESFYIWTGKRVDFAMFLRQH